MAAFGTRLAPAAGRSVVFRADAGLEAATVFPEHAAGYPGAAARAARRPLRPLCRYAGVDPFGDSGANGRGSKVRWGCSATGGSGGVVLQAKDRMERDACGG